jgi:hypothetical protein
MIGITSTVHGGEKLVAFPTTNIVQRGIYCAHTPSIQLELLRIFSIINAIGVNQLLPKQSYIFNSSIGIVPTINSSRRKHKIMDHPSQGRCSLYCFDVGAKTRRCSLSYHWLDKFHAVIYEVLANTVLHAYVSAPTHILNEMCMIVLVLAVWPTGTVVEVMCRMHFTAVLGVHV